MLLKVWLKRCLAVSLSAVTLIVPQLARSAPAVHPLKSRIMLGNMPPAAAHRTPAARVPSNITIADPPVALPDTKPCTVTLFKHVPFGDFSPKPFTFTPPPGCPGPWSKVVLSVNIAVTAGRQYDRTAEIGLGGATIFFGTTAEPFRNEGPSWTVTRDLTDLSALLRAPQVGQATIDNLYNSTYNGLIYGSATLCFYPPDKAYPAPRVADVVIPLADPNGNAVGLATPASRLDTPFIAPTNVESAYLDVIAQSQSQDEFWYTCVPNDLAGPLNDCGNTAFRETDAYVDGQPAGVSPVYPWIYTGGIDPFLWAPIPGVQTLNFIPYRVDLTPFAGQLDSGGTHDVALGEFNDDNYFAVTANLLLFLDSGAKHPLTGGLDIDTLAATPPESTQESGTFNPSGTVFTQSRRSYRIAGHVNTSHGLVRTQIDADVSFKQTDAIVNSATQFEQNISQDTRVNSLTVTSGSQSSSYRQEFDFPLALVYDYVVNADKTAQQQTTVRQSYGAGWLKKQPGLPDAWSLVFNTVSPKDTLHFDASGNFTSHTASGSWQVYKAYDSLGRCYGRQVNSADLVVTSNTKIACGWGY